MKGVRGSVRMSTKYHRESEEKKRLYQKIQIMIKLI